MIEVPPTQPLSAEQLAALLDDARRRTWELTHDLPRERLFGPKINIINPMLWEIGHVGFFHDYFALRLLHGLEHYQHPDAEGLYDSSSIPHGDRWQLPLPSLDDTWAYLDRVKQAMIERLPEGTASEAVSYVYQLTALHEDMPRRCRRRRRPARSPAMWRSPGASMCSVRMTRWRSASTMRSHRTA
jgi:iron(II)-dependent oxidoreductase